MYLLSITKIKYPKNDTIVLEFSDYDTLSKELKKLLDNKILTRKIDTDRLCLGTLYQVI